MELKGISMIFIGIGSNLAAKGFRSPFATINAALKLFCEYGILIEDISPWYESAPVPMSDQPWFVNGVMRVRTEQNPEETLWKLHQIENKFHRTRLKLNSARTLDLDLLDFNGLVTETSSSVILPHPRMEKRAFVLLPLRDIYSSWISPLTGAPIEYLIEQLSAEQTCKKLGFT